jgi:hypothetical protein
MKKLFLTSIQLLICASLWSQTGPGGVETSANNCFWIKADAGTSSTVNAAAISFWNDQSGNGNNVTQSTANQQPLYTANLINGFPAIQFDNVTTTNDKLIGTDSPTLDNTAGYTFFMVSRPQNIDGAARVIVSKRTTVSVDQSFMQFYFTGNDFHTDIQTTNNRYQTNTSFSANNNYLITQLYDGSLAAAFRCKTYIAGNLDVTAPEGSSTVPDNVSPIIVGSTDATDNRPFGGYIAEVIIYRKACNDPERIIVDNYLSSKYNIALSTNDKYAGDVAGNGNYDFEVAGVGKDATGSNPSFSASASGGLGISTTGTGFDNTDYILAGHATTTNSQVSTDVGGMTGTNNARWHRIWYVDITNTGTNIQANVEFDMSDGDVGAVTLGVNTDYVLLYRAAQTGNWTELTTATSVVGDRVLFNAFSFVNDGYYTIGTKNSVNSPLPIELLSFEAIRNGSKVDVSWKTISEKNNDYFIVERSKDAVNFETVAMVKGSSNSNSLLEYLEVDFEPLVGISYYRLKQIDNNGTYTYSKIVSVNYHFDNTGINVFPNPSNGDFTINLDGFEKKEVIVIVKDIAGKEFFSKVMIVQENNELIAVDLNGILSSGVYLVTASSLNTLYSKKIIIK